PDGQVNQTFRARPLLPLAWEKFAARQKPTRLALRELLRADPELADYRVTEIAQGGPTNRTLIVCVNGNEVRPWQEETEFQRALERRRHAVVAIDPRGVGSLRPNLAVRGHDYADPLAGVEENIAYNAFLVGKSLLGMRVTDVGAAVKRLVATTHATRVVLCDGRMPRSW